MAEEPSLRIEDLLAESVWLRRLARSLVGDEHLADDFAQEAMLAALRHPPRPGTQARAWLTGTLRNLVAAWRRGDAHRREREERLERRTAADPADLLEQVELQRLLAEALLALPEPFRGTVLQRYLQGLSSAEIARRTGTAEGTVRWRLKRGLDALRAELDERDERGRAGWTAAVAAFARTPEPSAIGLGPSLVAALAARRVAIGAALLAIALIALLRVALAPWIGRSAPALELAPAMAGLDRAAPSEELAAHPTHPTERSAAAERGASGAPASPLLITGRAVDGAGVPVAGARLAAPALPTVAAAVSGPDGRLALALGAPPATRVLELRLAAEGRIPRTLPARPRGEAVLELGELELRPAARLEGRVLDPAGLPAAGAEVLVDALPGRWDRARLRELPLLEWSYLGSMLPDSAPRAVTDGEGHFRFDALDEGYVRLWARAPGAFAGYSEPVALLAGETARAPELALVAPRPEELVTGRVVDPSGTPVSGAIVRAWRVTRPELYLEGDAMAYHARADTDGRFELPVNPNPRFELAARDASERFAPSAPVHARGGERAIELRLRARALFELRATGAKGETLASLELELVDAPSGVALETLRFEGGGTARAELPARSFLLRVRSPGWSERELGPFDPRLVSEPLACELERAPGLALRVTAAGEPVSGARVRLLALADEGRRRAFPALTRGPDPIVCAVAAEGPLCDLECAADGRAEIRMERAGPALLRVDAPGFAPVELGPLDAASALEHGELDIALGRGGALEGRVLVDPEREVAGTLVAAARADGELRVARVGPDGSFRFAGLAAGAWQVRALEHDLDEGGAGELALLGAREDETRARAAPRADVELVEGETARFDLDLRASASFVLEGELLFDGEAPGPWRVALARPAAPDVALVAASLDPRGRFRIALSEPGVYALRASLPDYRGARVVLRDRVALGPGGARWDVALETARLLPRAGALLDEHPTALHYVWRGDGELACDASLRAEAVADGLAFRVPAGRGRLVACEGGACDPIDAPSLRELELAPGSEVALPLR